MMVPLRKAPPKAWIPAFIALLLGAIFLAVALAGSGADAQGSVPVVSEPAPAGTLRSLRDVTGSTASRKPFEPEIAADHFAPRVGSADPAIRAASVAATGPTLLGSFDGIDSSHGSGIPPDPVGAVGKTQYVQAVNGSVSVYDKTTHAVLLGPIVLNALWTGYACTNAGCACSTQNDGDPIVLYDKAADRWFIAQFSLPHLGTNAGPSFECVAVSKTGDATGAYWLYDFPYSAWVNDQVKVAVWPDGYYASMNLFNSGGGIGTNYCVYERPAMLAGMPARQYCALKPITSPAIPADLDGATPPPDGSPGYFLGLDASTTQLDLWMLHVDWATIGNSTLTGPVAITVPSYAAACGGGNCIAQPSPGVLLPGLDDRLMFRVAYRNFGDHEALVANHAVAAAPVTGIRWYEIRSPASTPVVQQSASYAPDTALYRWNASIAMDRKGDIALGYSASSGASDPSIRFSGRLAGDTPGDMAAETLLFAGTGVEPSVQRWGDYSTLTIDPVDDCTFWYTNEYYTSKQVWRTRIGQFMFAGCTQDATTTLLSTACMTSFVAGSPFTMTAAVTPSSATGTVDFDDGQGTTLCSGSALQTGSATCATSTLAPGAYMLAARYGGDASDAPSDSNGLPVVVLSASDVVMRNGFDPVPGGCPAM